VKDYLAGAGMGYAKAAELNHYPGPMHTLELADQLGLSPEQRAAMAALMKRHQADARELGGQVVRLEGELDALFAHQKATPELVDAKLAELGAVQARYRGSHLKTHLEATKLLTPAQVARYDALRGYGAAAPAGHSGHGQGHKH
jgi:Spy/CpxP family protein refolding chaperone